MNDYKTAMDFRVSFTVAKYDSHLTMSSQPSTPAIKGVMKSSTTNIRG